MQDEESWHGHPDAVILDDGEIWLQHKGKLETIGEREARLQHNTYMRFTRSFASVFVADWG